MLRKRLSIIALTAATVTAITLTTAQPAQAEWNENACRVATQVLWTEYHLFTWYYTFYGPNHPETIQSYDRFMLFLEAAVGVC